MPDNLSELLNVALCTVIVLTLFFTAVAIPDINR